MKKTLLILSILFSVPSFYGQVVIANSFQVVNPTDDIKLMFAEERYKEIIDKYSSRPRNLSSIELVYVARAYLQFEDLESAAIFAQLATEKDVNSAEAYYIDGIISNMIGDHSQAQNKLKKAIALSPEISDFYIALGDVYFAQEKYSQALDYYKQATKLASPSEKAYYMTGAVYAAMDKEDDALKSFYEAKNKILHDKELYVTLLYNIGKMEYDNGNYKKAADVYKELTTYFPDDYYSYEKLVQCCNSLKDYAQADKMKEKMYSAYRNGELSSTSLSDMFTVEHFNVGDKNVAAYERYEVVADKPVTKNIFYVSDNDGNIESVISLEYTPSADSSRYNFVMTKGAERLACGVKFNDSVSYKTLKQSVTDIVEGKTQLTSLQ